MLRVAAIGECMVELQHRDERLLELGFAGDSFNTALYMARCTRRERLAVDYMTALGTDPYSEAMLKAWRAEGIGADRVARLPGRLPGLYFIRTDAAGERRFFYYRSAAAARELFRDAASESLLEALPGYDVLYFTAITLSLLDPAARERFRLALATARAAGRLIAFDSNYRPAGWSDADAARAAIAPFLDTLTLALPTFEDEQALWGDAAMADTIARYAPRGIEVCVKRGEGGCFLADGECVPVPQRIIPIDTTGAGDSFNAAYLTARLAGHPPAEAARAGHILAGTVIRHKGAIMPRDAAIPAFPGYEAA
ncbi:MAG TPA: sugar kinase [Stellaceae bacterium]|nr:sugar kinase [Stellaceae bacterium]